MLGRYLSMISNKTIDALILQGIFLFAKLLD